MPFRSIVATPEELARIAAAFGEIAARVDPPSEPVQRERLASIIAELWRADPSVDLAVLAVQRFDETASKGPGES